MKFAFCTDFDAMTSVIKKGNYVRIYNKVHWLLRVIARLKSMQSLNCTIVLRYAYAIIKKLFYLRYHLAESNTYFIDFTFFATFGFLPPFMYKFNDKWFWFISVKTPIFWSFISWNGSITGKSCNWYFQRCYQEWKRLTWHHSSTTPQKS